MVMKETLNGFQGGLQIGGQMVTNICYADDIILLATFEAELQQLVDRLDWVSCKYSLLTNVNKTKVMASDGKACRILIQNKQLEQVSTFPYLGSVITEDGRHTMEQYCPYILRNCLCFFVALIKVFLYNFQCLHFGEKRTVWYLTFNTWYRKFRFIYCGCDLLSTTMTSGADGVPPPVQSELLCFISQKSIGGIRQMMTWLKFAKQISTSKNLVKLLVLTE